MSDWTYLWIGTVPEELWQLQPGPTEKGLLQAALIEAGERDYTLVGELDLHVKPDPNLPAGLLLAVVTGPARRPVEWVRVPSVSAADRIFARVE